MNVSEEHFLPHSAYPQRNEKPKNSWKKKLSQLLDFKQPNYSFHRKLNDLFFSLSICAQGLIINFHWVRVPLRFIFFFSWFCFVSFFSAQKYEFFDGLYPHSEIFLNLYHFWRPFCCYDALIQPICYKISIVRQYHCTFFIMSFMHEMLLLLPLRLGINYVVHKLSIW